MILKPKWANNSHTRENWFSYLTMRSFKQSLGSKHWKFLPLPFEQHFSSWRHEYSKTRLKTKKRPFFQHYHILFSTFSSSCFFSLRFSSSNLLSKGLTHALSILLGIHFLITKDRDGQALQAFVFSQKRDYSTAQENWSQNTNDWISSRILTSDQQHLIGQEHF